MYFLYLFSVFHFHTICFFAFTDVARAIELLEQLQRCSDLQPAKLAVLQRILQSDFCDMVREVYEHVYETVEVEGSTEVRASATAKATVAAFAASEGHAHPRVVELPKTEEGLGFNVMGGKEQNSPIYISRIIPGELIIYCECYYITTYYIKIVARVGVHTYIRPRFIGQEDKNYS